MVLPITLSLPTQVEVELGCDNMLRYSRVESCVCKVYNVVQLGHGCNNGLLKLMPCRGCLRGAKLFFCGPFILRNLILVYLILNG